MPAEARTYGNGSSEMRVLLSTYGSHGYVEPMVGLAVQLRALGAELLARVGAPVVPLSRGREVTSIAQDDAGVDVELSEEPS
jgi:2-polyprenyl-6-methoxyphenol hydroxylase-like FAD-dependent oxidoreductase